VPARACDCHVHIYDARFPLAAKSAAPGTWCAGAQVPQNSASARPPTARSPTADRVP